jgi:uncharacterized protein (UPF0332 family)
MEENVRIRIKEEIEVAKTRLKAAKLLFEKGMLEDAVNRAYYTFFYAAKAMLNALGFDAKTHSGLISEFGLRIIKTNMLGKELAQYFRRAFEMRESSDYEIGIIFSEDEVQTLIKNAEDFLKKAQEFIEKRL